MRLELTGRHVDISSALRRMIERKLQRLDRLLGGSILSVHAVLARERRTLRADLTIHVGGDKFLHGSGEGGAWPLALGRAVEKTVQQAAQVKGKWQKRKRRTVALSEQETGAAPPARAGARRPKPPQPHLVEVSREPLRPMSVADAAREIGANGDGVVVFRDQETAAVRVLYRRVTGELRLVDTEV